jgi:hypothetical protein
MLSRKKIAVLTLAAVAGATIILTQTASSNGQAYKLEGAWTLSSGVGDLLANVTVAPDPSGHRATAKVNWVTVGPTIAWYQALFGADTSTDGNYALEMISRDTVKYSGVFYWIKTGTPNEIKMIFLHWGTMKYTGPDTIVVQKDDRWAGYLPGRDANGDGLPDNLESPDLGPVEGAGVFTRIPMLP